jgi:UDP-N-acetylmuramyl pentapeptide phosphotransferase/UDP-N-acetylglucosamine-1-phosphate transferase
VTAMLAIYPISTGYQIMALLHIAAAVVAFGPLLVYPTLREAAPQRLAKLHMTMSFPALLLLWVLGMGMAGMSDDTFKVSQTWMVLAIIDWAILMVVSWFLIKPAITDSSEPARAKFSAGVGITHLGMVVGLILMIWKPGSPL